jgi:hypothetical protein
LKVGVIFACVRACLRCSFVSASLKFEVSALCTVYVCSFGGEGVGGVILLGMRSALSFLIGICADLLWYSILQNLSTATIISRLWQRKSRNHGRGDDVELNVLIFVATN